MLAVFQASTKFLEAAYNGYTDPVSRDRMKASQKKHMITAMGKAAATAFNIENCMVVPARCWAKLLRNSMCVWAGFPVLVAVPSAEE